MGTHLRATERHLPYGITGLPATWHKWTRPALTPLSQTGSRFTYPRGIEGWVDLGSLIAARPLDRKSDAPTVTPPSHQKRIHQLRTNGVACCSRPVMSAHLRHYMLVVLVNYRELLKVKCSWYVVIMFCRAAFLLWLPLVGWQSCVKFPRSVRCSTFPSRGSLPNRTACGHSGTRSTPARSAFTITG